MYGYYGSMADDFESLSDCFNYIHQHGELEKAGEWMRTVPTMNIIDHQLPAIIQSILENIGYPKYQFIIRGTSGAGSWCSVMYVCVFRNSPGKTKHCTTSGAYVAYLFSEDCNTVHLCFMLGAGTKYENTLKRQSKAIRELIDTAHFSTDASSISLSEKNRHRYREGIICFKTYNLDKMPSEKELVDDLQDMITIQCSISEEDIRKILYS